MGFWDSIISGESGAAPKGKKVANPFAISLRFLPMRLSANDKNSVNLIVDVKNISSDPQLTSVDALLPRGTMLGFDEAGINKATEKRIGELKAGESREVSIPIWANRQTKEGKYDVEVTIYSHYIGYNKVLSYIKKSTSLRVV